MANGDKDTYQGSLLVLLRQLPEMKVLADANLPFLIELETMIMQEYNDPQRKMQQAGITPPPGMNPQGSGQLGLPGGGGMGAPPPSMGPPPGMPMQGAGAPQSAGELNAILGRP